MCISSLFQNLQAYIYLYIYIYICTRICISLSIRLSSINITYAKVLGTKTRNGPPQVKLYWRRRRSAAGTHVNSATRVVHSLFHSFCKTTQVIYYERAFDISPRATEAILQLMRSPSSSPLSSPVSPELEVVSPEGVKAVKAALGSPEVEDLKAPAEKNTNSEVAKVAPGTPTGEAAWDAVEPLSKELYPHAFPSEENVDTVFLISVLLCQISSSSLDIAPFLQIRRHEQQSWRTDNLRLFGDCGKLQHDDTYSTHIAAWRSLWKGWMLWRSHS